MSVKKKGLGRGLSDLGLNELLSRMSNEKQMAAASSSTNSSDTELKQVAIDLIKPGKYQPRREMDPKALEDLAESIKSQGIIQPIVIRKVKENTYEIVAGERRWRAARLAGLKEIPALVRDIPDEAAIAVALIENIQRENLNAIEEALALHRLGQEFSLTHQEIATIVGKSRATISNLLRLLTLPTSVKELVEKGDLEMGHARAILALMGDEFRQSQVAHRVVERGMSVRETEDYIRRLFDLADPPNRVEKEQHLVKFEKSLAKKLGVRVAIRSKDAIKGKLIVYYRNKEQLDSILKEMEEKLLR